MNRNEQHPPTRSRSKDIARRAGVSSEALRRVFCAILEEVDLGNEVTIEGFGKFRVRETPERVVKTPVVPGGVAHHKSKRFMSFSQARGASRKLNQE